MNNNCQNYNNKEFLLNQYSDQCMIVKLHSKILITNQVEIN